MVFGDSECSIMILAKNTEVISIMNQLRSSLFLANVFYSCNIKVSREIKLSSIITKCSFQFFAMVSFSFADELFMVIICSSYPCLTAKI